MRAILLLLISMTTAAFSQSTNEFQKRTYHNAKGDTILYRILFPKNYDKTKKYPLLVFLHGAGERGNDNEKQLTHGAKLFLRDDMREKFPAIILFPQCPQDSYWSSVKIDNTKTPRIFDFDYHRDMTRALRAAMSLTQHMVEEEAVDKKRVYITGLSMGGMGTFEAIYHFPKLFAAAAPICGGGDTKLYSKAQAKVPFWIFHGDKDPVVDVSNSRNMVERLKKLKGDVRYSEYHEVGHNSWDNAFAEPEFLAWIFSQKK